MHVLDGKIVTVIRGEVDTTDPVPYQATNKQGAHADGSRRSLCGRAKGHGDCKGKSRDVDAYNVV